MAANNNLSLTELCRVATEQGWTMRKTSQNHEIWKSPTGETVTIGKDANAAAGDFRRAGLVIPGGEPTVRMRLVEATPQQAVEALKGDVLALSAALDTAINLVYETADSVGELRKSLGEIAAELRGSIKRADETAKAAVHAYSATAEKWNGIDQRLAAAEASLASLATRADPIDAFRKRLQG